MWKEIHTIMTAKSFLIVGALTFASFGIASAKSYDIVLSQPTMAGTATLQPGEYKLKVENNQATFTDVQNQKSVTAPVKVQNATQKYNATQVETSHQGDMDHISTIELAGSTTQLNFQ
jgi:hypothetical protein